MFLFLLWLALQSSQVVELKNFEVLRVNPAELEKVPPSLRSIFVDLAPSADVVDTIEEAATKAGFTPKLPKVANKPAIGVIDPVHGQATIGVEEVRSALKDAQAEEVAVPENWNDTVIAVQQAAGVLTDYGTFFMTQAPHLTLNAPAGFPLDRFMEIVFRITGINASDAGALRQKFAANPTAFLPISNRFNMDIHEVHLSSGSGVLLQNGDKVGELALVWNSADRTYVITGQVTESRAIELANSIQ